MTSKGFSLQEFIVVTGGAALLVFAINLNEQQKAVKCKDMGGTYIGMGYCATEVSVNFTNATTTNSFQEFIK